MSGSLSGQVAIVTGGGRGIGRAIAEGFAAEGAAVAVTARTMSQLEEVTASIESAGGKALPIAADVTVQANVERLVADTEKTLGPVDILINNAGTQERGGQLWKIDPELWKRTIEVNLFGQFLVTRTVLPGMIERRRGRIVNMSSAAGSTPGGYTYFSAYAASKAGLNRMTETLSNEVREYGISVFAIHPGGVHTEVLKTNFDPDLEKLVPGRADRMWSVDTPVEKSVDLCRFLVSGAADALSGAYLTIDDDVAEVARRADEVQSQDLYRPRVNRLSAK
jgi:NAD(P)-dependent dehydrogenase (short-subunit alcohol dehydrogenase family)